MLAALRTKAFDERRLLDLIDTSSGQNWFASCFERIAFACDNTNGILDKDIESALDAASEGTDTSLVDAVRQAILSLKPRPR